MFIKTREELKKDLGSLSSMGNGPILSNITDSGKQLGVSSEKKD